MLPLLLVYAGLAVLVGVYASSMKGRSGIGFGILSLLVSPVIGFIIVLMVKANADAVAARRA